MGWIEHYGTGIRRVRKMFLDYGLDEPKYETLSGGMAVTVLGLKFENDTEVSIPVTIPVTVPVTVPVGELLFALEKEMSRTEMQNKLQLSNKAHFLTNYLQPAIEQGFVTMKFPQNPNHPKQRYYLTPKGIELKTEKLNGNSN